MTLKSSQKDCFSVAVVGAGIAGSTIALRLAELGIATTLIDRSSGLVSGPPICHLHAGGNLYREISDEQCLTLLEQSIDTLRVFGLGANRRPTLIAQPLGDRRSMAPLLDRLAKLQRHYEHLIGCDPRNRVLGDPADYYKLFDRDQTEALARRAIPPTPMTQEDWIVPVARELDLDLLRFPLVLVQEYGLSVFRLAAMLTLAVHNHPYCTPLLGTEVVDIVPGTVDSPWQVTMRSGEGMREILCDYMVNACGFRTGRLDNMLRLPRERMVEFKAAYVSRWPKAPGYWPELVIHGERGTPTGMAQLTPYADGFFQLHGMTEEITLFRNGLARSSSEDAQPLLPDEFMERIDNRWSGDEVKNRTKKAIRHIARFVPGFAEAHPAGLPLFGAQQIPGGDPSLRAATVSFGTNGYARCEIVKASSALASADAIVEDVLARNDRLKSTVRKRIPAYGRHLFPLIERLTPEEVERKAEEIARERGYPEALATFFPGHESPGSAD